MKQCPECSGPGHVIDNRPTQEMNTMRRYGCKEYAERWTTLEILAPDVCQSTSCTLTQSFYQAQVSRVGILRDEVENHYKLLGEIIKDLKRGGV